MWLVGMRLLVDGISSAFSGLVPPGSHYDTHSYIDVLVARRHTEAIGGPAKTADVVTGAAAHHAQRADGRTLGIKARAALVVVALIVIGAPFPDVAVHVIEAERIGRVGADLGGALQVGSALRHAVGIVAVKIRFSRGNGHAARERHGQSRAAGVFPLGFGGQAVSPARFLFRREVRQLFAEFHRFEPGNA